MKALINRINNSSFQWRILIFLLAKVISVQAGLRETLESDEIGNLKTATQNIVRTTATHDVFLVVDNSSTDEWTQTVINAVSDSVSGIYPIQMATLEQLNSIRLQPQQLATSRTLAVLVTRMDSDLSHKLFFSIKHTPKLLLIVILFEPSAYFIFLINRIFELWGILDSVVIEVQRFKKRKVSLIVHQYNPFNGDYTRQPVNANITDWFPNKMLNLHGCKIGVQPTYFCNFSNEFNNSFELHGEHVETFYAFRDVMNFTIEEAVYENATLTCVEIVLRYNSDYELVELYTFPFRLDRECLVIPRISVNSSDITMWGIASSFLVGACIVLIFWIISILLKVDKRLRHPINTVSLILGVSIPEEPRRFFEKILFIFLVIASIRYTAVFYTELYNLGVMQVVDLDISSFEDLDWSGLPCGINRKYIELISDDMPNTLKQRVFAVEDVHKVGLREFLSWNISSFMIKIAAEIVAAQIGPDGKPLMKLTSFCIFSTYSAYPLIRGRAYGNRMNDILLRIQESGMREKWSERIIIDGKSVNYRQYVQGENQSLETSIISPPEIRMVFYLFYLYLVPWIVFFGEVIYDWWIKRKRMIPKQGRSRFRITKLFRRRLKARRMSILKV